MPDTSSAYEELFKLYAENRTAFRDYYLGGARIASAFSVALHQHLGLPNTFAADGGEQQPWVRLYSRSEDNEVEPTTWSQLDSWTDDGELRFGVGVALSHQLNSYPKNYFWAGYLLIPSSNGFALKETWGKQVVYSIGANDDFMQPIESFVNVLRETLSATPAEAFRKEKTPSIGFLN